LSPLTTSIILSFNKIQKGDILVLANAGQPGKWLVKTERERERQTDRQTDRQTEVFALYKVVFQQNQGVVGNASPSHVVRMHTLAVSDRETIITMCTS